MLLNMPLMKMYYDEASSAAAGQQGNGQSDNQEDHSNDETIETFLNSLDPKLKEKGTQLLTTHIEKLQNAVKATREERDAFQLQLKDAIKKAGKDSDLGKQLETLSSQLDEANHKADFYEAAETNGCHNPKAAFLIAKSADTFTKSGAVDWKALQELAPEFFGDKRQTTKKKTAGSGTGKEPSGSMSMNEWIRAQANK